MSLASWRDGPARDAITGYVARVTEEGGAEHVPPAERIAVFDNDGTLWCEKPAYLQALFILGAPARAGARRTRRWASAPWSGRCCTAISPARAAAGKDEMMKVLLDTHAGLTTDEFTAAALRWLDGFRHPRFGTPFSGLVYAPMLELMELLRAHGFRVFIVTGGGVDFVRAVGSQLYGVEPDDVVGTALRTRFDRRDGRVTLVRSAELAGSPNEGPPKVENIHAHLGRRPIVAVGNSAGDREMLEYAHTGERPSLCLVLDHDDEEREYAYAARR